MLQPKKNKLIPIEKVRYAADSLDDTANNLSNDAFDRIFKNKKAAPDDLKDLKKSKKMQETRDRYRKLSDEAEKNSKNFTK